MEAQNHDGKLPWHWYTPETAVRWWPAPAESGAPPHPDDVAAALAPAANDRSQILVVVGFAEEALAIIAADPLLSGKDIVWIVAPGRLNALTTALLAGRGAGTSATIGVCAHDSDIPGLVERLPLLCWSLAVLDGDPETVRRFQYWRTQRLYSCYFVLERTITDLVHLLHREDRLGGAIPLRRWHGRYAGRAALCIAAGPSVDRHLALIRRVQDRCVVICADIMHRRLAEAGVRVDFIINVDSHELLASRIPAPVDPQAVLVMPLNGHRELDQRIPRRTYTCDDPFGAFLLGDGSGFTTGTNVGCATLGFASWLGCTEAVLIGHDLAFTPDCYYSQLVADRAGIEERSQRVSRGAISEVDGNDGGKVQTNPGFRLGIRDLGMLIEHVGEAMRVYNPNINLCIGARIPGAIALPEGWQPPGGGACPRPDAEPETPDAPPARRLAAAITERLPSYRAAWDEELAKAGGDAIAAFAALGERAELVLVHHLAVPVLMGHIAQLFRLGAVPSLVPTAELRAATVAAMTATLARWEAELARALAERDWRLPPGAAFYSPAQAGFFVALRQQVPVLPPWSLDEALVPLVARDWRCLLETWPDLELPPPMSFYDGLQLCAFLGDRTPPAFLLQTLALCALDVDGRVDYALSLAVEHGIIGQGAFGGGGPVLVPMHPCVGAVRAALALGAGTSRDPEADARTAAAWAPGRLDLVRRLLAGALPDSGGPRLCAALIREGLIIPDDAIAEVVISRYPDIPEACELLHPFEASFGEGVTMAMARRLAALGDRREALAQLDRIRPLSCLAPEAWSLALACLVDAGLGDRLEERLNRLPGHDLRVRALHRFMVERAGVRQATLMLAGQGFEPIPHDLLAAMVVQAMPDNGRAVDAEVLAAIAAMLGASQAAARLRPGQDVRLAELRSLVDGISRLTGAR